MAASNPDFSKSNSVEEKSSVDEVTGADPETVSRARAEMVEVSPMTPCLPACRLT